MRLDHLLSRVELAEDADGYEVDSIARCYKQRERVTEKLFTVRPQLQDLLANLIITTKSSNTVVSFRAQ